MKKTPAWKQARHTKTANRRAAKRRARKAYLRQGYQTPRKATRLGLAADERHAIFGDLS